MTLSIFHRGILKKINRLVYYISLKPVSSVFSKSERTRQFIIEKSAPVFNAKGYVGTSYADLIAATGLTKGCIYGIFENKDEVALAAFDFNFARVTEYIKQRILAVDNSVERLLVYPTVYRNFLKIPFLQQGCPILNTATEADDTHPQLSEKASAALCFWRTSIENQVKRGIERKEIKSSANPDEVAAVITSLVEGAIMQAKVTRKSKQLKLAMGFLERYIKDLGT